MMVNFEPWQWILFIVSGGLFGLAFLFQQIVSYKVRKRIREENAAETLKKIEVPNEHH